MPDIVILNGRLITFNGNNSQALAISDGRISAIGSNAAIESIAGDAQVIDAAGATVLPGFIDSHVHLFAGAAELDRLTLRGVNGADALRTRITEYSANNPNDQMLLAMSLEYHAFRNNGTTRHDLDRILPDRPFAAIAPDLHTVWANTKALQAAGLFNGAATPDGSEIVMAADGFASGELRETGAFGPLLALTALGGRELLGYVNGKEPQPPASAAQRALDKSVIANGLRHCASQGITGLHNMDGNFYQLELLTELHNEGRLLCRTEVPMHLKAEDSLQRLSEAGQMKAQYNNDFVWCNRVKMFMDGVIDSKTAYMLQPYPQTTHCSEALFPPEKFNEACCTADAMGLQIAVHAIGDAAVRQTLDGYEAAINANGKRDSRHRIEHIETIHPADIPRLKSLGVVASMQPLHSPRGNLFAPYEPGDLLHAHQFAHAFAWQSIREAGVPVVFSTDWPVVPLDVMPGIQAAVQGTALPDIWPQQSQSLTDALASYTRDNAWVEFNEHCKGKLKEGYYADVVIMNCDLQSLPLDNLHQAAPVTTICAGNITYQQ